MTDRIKGMKDLSARITELELLEKKQLADLRKTFEGTVESISPGNLLKHSLQQVVTSPGLRNSLVDTAIGIGAGIIGKKIFVGRSSNIIKKLGGTAIEFLLANIIRKRIPQLRKKKNEAPEEVQPAGA